MLFTIHIGNGLPFQSLSAYVTNIHVEPPEETGEDRTVLYDIPSSNVIEFRGSHFPITLSYQDINYLLEDNLDLCNEEGNSALKWILLGYKRNCTQPNSQFKGDILGYMTFLFKDTNREMYKRVVGKYVPRIRDAVLRQHCKDDLIILKTLAAMETPTIDVR